ncbi:MAG: hypothetical protein WA830_05260 [Candidatus Sulfotelmatobacter sp.]
MFRRLAARVWPTDVRSQLAIFRLVVAEHPHLPGESGARAFSEHDFDSFAPALVNPHELPLDLGGDVAQQDVGGGMNV